MRINFLYLLVLLILVIITLPWLQTTTNTSIFSLGALSLILLFSLYTLSDNKKALIGGIALLIPSLAFDYLGVFFHVFHLIAHPWNALFLIYIVSHIAYVIIRQRTMDHSTVFGALCLYLLLGFTFAQLYDWIDLLVPQAFNNPIDGHSIYFSFVTLTTLGYGDIYPVSKFAQSLSVVEAIIGQLYIATAIACAIGNFIQKGLKHDKDC